MFKRYLKITVM